MQLNDFSVQDQNLIVQFGIQCLSTHKSHCKIEQPQQVIEDSDELKGLKHQLDQLLNVSLQQKQLLSDSILGSAKKGAFGEQQVLSAIQQQYPFATIHETSKVANSGDLIVTIDNCNILVEVKNYSKTVPTSEVLKFQNDVNTTQCSFGIFMSIQQRIAGKPRISMEDSQKGKQTLYLAEQQSVDLLLISIDLMIKMYKFKSGQQEKKKINVQLLNKTLTTSITQIKKQKLQTEKQLEGLQQTLQFLLQSQSAIFD